MGANAYLKVAIGLETLREYILDPVRMDTAFRRYAQAWAFKRPEPWDFFRAISGSVTQELGWFWKGWFLDNKPIDIAIDTVISRAVSVSPEVARVLLVESREAGEAYIAYLRSQAQPEVSSWIIVLSWKIRMFSVIGLLMPSISSAMRRRHPKRRRGLSGLRSQVSGEGGL